MYVLLNTYSINNILLLFVCSYTVYVTVLRWDCCYSAELSQLRWDCGWRKVNKLSIHESTDPDESAYTANTMIAV